jgi:peptidoglycan/LPS O-acetylase OafA/YrhL
MARLATTLEPPILEGAVDRRAVARSSTAQAEEDRLAFADVFRALAIFAVVLNHLALISGIHPFDPRDDFGFLGAWGVNGFFILSGYLLSRPYLEAVLRMRPFPSTRLFLTRRFYRIYPLYAFAVVVSGAEAAMHAPHQLPLASMLSHLTFLHGFSMDDVVSLNAPLWTMAVDAQFYLLLPLGAFALRASTRGRDRATTTGIVAGAIAGVAACSIALRWSLFAHDTVSIVGDSVGRAFVLARNVVGMGTAFALGGLLALLALLGKRPTPIVAYGSAILGIAGLLFLGWCARVYGTTPAYGVYYDPLAAVSAALVLCGFGEGAFRVTHMVRGSRSVAAVAALAYAVYLFHWLVLDVVVSVAKRADWTSGTLEYFAGISVPTLIVTFIVAAVTHRVVERPFLSLRDRNRERAARRRVATAES